MSTTLQIVTLGIIQTRKYNAVSRKINISP